MTGTTALDPAEARRRQLAELLRRRAAGSAERQLSVGQERILRLARLVPDLPLYNVAAGWRIEGPLDVPVLIRAVTRIRDRHDILRSTFHETETGPMQRIAPPQANGPGPVHEIDLTARPDIAAAVIAREAACHFDLAEGPLWRLVLLRLGPSEHQMLLVMHHIVTDGWSYDLFVAELAALYGAFRAGAEDPLPALALQYADFGDRQRQDLGSPETAAQAEAWAARLDGPIPALVLPGAGTGDGATGPDGARIAASLPAAVDPALATQLSALARAEGATLFMVLLAGFAALLARRTGQTDLLICIPASGRHRALSKGLIGYFNNILPLRIDASGAPSLRDLVRRTRAATLDAYRGQDVPFQRLADLPALRRVPLSRLLFSLDMPWPPAASLEGLVCAPLVTETGTADFDLSVSLWMEGEGVQGAVRRKTALFSEAAVQDLIADYGALLAALAEDPEQPLGAAAAVAAREAGTGIPDHSLLPRSALEAQLAQEWEQVFDIHPIGRNEDLGRLGVSSLAVAELAEHLKSVFGTEISVLDLFRAGTVARMAEQLAEGGVAASPLAPIRPAGARAPLFLCEGVGIYYPLLPHLPEDLPVYGLIQQVSAAGSSRVEDRAAAYVAAVRAVQPEGPYHLGGVSYGGMVAFEMAQLRAAGQETALLALLDTPGPGAYRPYQGMRRAIGYAQNAFQGGPDYLKAKLRTRLRRRRPAPAAPAGPIPDQALLRAGFSRSAAAYSVRPYDGKITLFALAHRSAFTDSLFDPALGQVDPLLGWGAVARGGVEHWPLPGEHVGILKEPHVAVLGALLRACLQRESAASG